MVNLGAFLMGSGKQQPNAMPAPPSRLSPLPQSSSTPVPVLTSDNDDPLPIAAPAARVTAPGQYNALRLAAVIPKHIPLDYSFMQLTDIHNLGLMEPRAGQLARQKQTTKAARSSSLGPKQNQAKPSEGATADGTAWDFGSSRDAKTERTKDGFLVVRAGDETYAFKDEEELQRQRKAMFEDDDMIKYELNDQGILVEKKRGKNELGEGGKRYDCTSLKLDNNLLTSQSLQPLCAVVTRLVSSPFRSITSLDLSWNQITVLPKLDDFPLHTLLLHCNRIPTLAEVSKLQTLNRTLRKLTLNENPFQERVLKYKYAVLHQLPFLTFLDDVRVTDKDRQRIAVFEELFVPAAQRGTTRKYLPALQSPTPM